LDSARFDHLTRAVATLRSRRTLAGVLGLSALALPGLADARKKRKKKKKIKKNQFGCVDVGNFCKNGGQCCSGICEGKKGKKKCKAHDASTCVAGQTIDDCGGSVNVLCTATGGDPGACLTTTGNAPYCATSLECFSCQQDVDCEPICGQGAACLPCAGQCAEEGGTLCAGISGVACNPP
jgi:hypothetical protein